MAQFEKSPLPGGEMSRRFIEFVLMQGQQAALFLGQIPNPATGKTETNLEIARFFIDQLEMIREKTRGNLNADEERILGNTLGALQIGFVEAGDKSSASPPAVESSQSADETK